MILEGFVDHLWRFSLDEDEVVVLFLEDALVLGVNLEQAGFNLVGLFVVGDAFSDVVTVGGEALPETAVLVPGWVFVDFIDRGELCL